MQTSGNLIVYEWIIWATHKRSLLELAREMQYTGIYFLRSKKVLMNIFHCFFEEKERATGICMFSCSRYKICTHTLLCMHQLSRLSFFGVWQTSCSDFLAGDALRSSRCFYALRVDETAFFGCACRHEFCYVDQPEARWEVSAMHYTVDYIDVM